MNFEIGLLNSFRPFFRKYVWMENANRPVKHKIKENIKPVSDCL